MRDEHGAVINGSIFGRVILDTGDRATNAVFTLGNTNYASLKRFQIALRNHPDAISNRAVGLVHCIFKGDFAHYARFKDVAANHPAFSVNEGDGASLGHVDRRVQCNAVCGGCDNTTRITTAGAELVVNQDDVARNEEC